MIIDLSKLSPAMQEEIANTTIQILEKRSGDIQIALQAPSTIRWKDNTVHDDLTGWMKAADELVRKIQADLKAKRGDEILEKVIFGDSAISHDLTKGFVFKKGEIPL